MRRSTALWPPSGGEAEMPRARDRERVLPRHAYVHVPFCARRCAYCDFAIAVRSRVPLDPYLEALAREVSIRFPPGQPWIADTLYLGGGTPSLLGASGVARLMDVLRSRITLAPGAEITLEANPDDVTALAVRAWRAAGVNRLSLGSQSFDDRVLGWMRRTHTAGQVQLAVDAARDAGFDNISLDLIFGLPSALGREWALDLERALALRPEHLSLYGLTVEDHTPLQRWRDRGVVVEAPEEGYEREYLAAHAAAEASGLRHYEVSNYARPGFESRHNSSYWSGVAYAGLGPSAHEFDGLRRRWNVPAYAEWVRRLSAGRDPLAGAEELSDANRYTERVYLGLRTSAGLVVEPNGIGAVRRWVAQGWATLDGRRLRLTPTGWLRLDALATVLTSAPSRC